MNIRNRRDKVTFRVLVVLLACWLVFLLWSGNRDRSSPCVLEYPRYVVSALVSPSQPLSFLQQEPYEYYLYYRGRRALTDEVCTEPICVTEKEYKRFMRVEK